MVDIETTVRTTVKKYSTFSLVLAIILVNIWFINNGESVLPPDIYTQDISIVYGLILAVVMALWIGFLFATGRMHKIKELYDLSIKDSIIGMFLGSVFVIMVFWVVFGAILGTSARDLGWEGYLALIALHGLIVAPMETITAQKMVVDIMGYIGAAIFFAGMHGAVYGFSLGGLLFAFTMGYIWSRMIGLKTEKWYYGIFGMGFVIAWHATYNIALTVYSAKMLMILSFAGPYAWIILLVVVGIVVVEVLRNRLSRNDDDYQNDDIDGDDENPRVSPFLLLLRRRQDLKQTRESCKQ